MCYPSLKRINPPPFSFVATNSPDVKRLAQRYKVHPSLDTVLLFNEDAARPVASVSMAEIPTTTLTNVIAANQYLALPRLSSQDLLEGICPTEWNRPRKRLCVILVTANTDRHDEARQAVRRMALESGFSADRVRFAYIFEEKQSEFVRALRPPAASSSSSSTADDSDAKPATTTTTTTTATPTATAQPNDGSALLRLVIIWRRDASHIKYEWVSDVSLHWSQPTDEDDDDEPMPKQQHQQQQTNTSDDVDDDGIDTMGTTTAAPPRTTHAPTTSTSMPPPAAPTRRQVVDFAYNATKEKLESNIQRLLRSSEALSYEAHVKDLLDEHALGMLAHIVHRALLTFEYLADNIGREHVLPVLSGVASVALVLCIGYVMAFLVREEEEKVKRQTTNEAAAAAANNDDGMRA